MVVSHIIKETECLAPLNLSKRLSHKTRRLTNSRKVSYAHLDEDKNSICERKNSIALQGWKPVRSFFWSFLSLTISKIVHMEYRAISKKTMRSKDFKALKAKKPGYRMHVATTEDNTKEVLFRTPRGFFLQDSSEPAIEISVTQAQAFYDTYGIRVETGW